MSKLSKVLFMIWIVLALVSFIVSFWAPVLFKVIGLVFGGMNMLIILSWLATFIQDVKLNKKLNAGE